MQQKSKRRPFIRLSIEEREEELLILAAQIAEKNGYQSIERNQLTEAAKVGPALIYRYFTSMSKLKECVVKYAIKNNNYRVMAQALANNHPLTKKLSKEAKTSIGKFLIDN